MTSEGRLRSSSVSLRSDSVLADPETSRWPALVRANQALRAYTADRSLYRAELLERARDYTCRTLGLTTPAALTTMPVVATGHQPTWHHCGIWMKTVACSKLARVVRGTAVQVVLDHDICSTTMAVPQSRPDGTWYCRWFSIEPDCPHGPLELRHPQARCIHRFLDHVMEASPEQFCDAVWARCDVADAARWGRLRSVADVVTCLQAVLNAALGLDNVLYLPVSKISTTDAFLSFVASVASNAMHFSWQYNDALAQESRKRGKRRLHDIRAQAMDSTRGQTELPFWLMRPDGERVSLHASRKTPGVVAIMAASSEAGRLDAGSVAGRARQLRGLLAQHGWMLRPKAVSLTLFLRLYLADWFIHGIGGAAYEPVTDHVVRNCFGMKPPSYGVITCTETLPRCRAAYRPPRKLGPIRHRLHHIEHNPELCLGAAERERDRARLLIQAKKRQVLRASDCTLAACQRKAAWRSIALINERLRGHVTRKIQDLQREMTQVEAETTSQAVCNSREYFFGLFPEWRLHTIADVARFDQAAENARPNIHRD